MQIKNTREPGQKKTDYNLIKGKAFFFLYNLCWQAAIPLLKINKRTSEGFEQRILKHKMSAADIWIQAASAGEAYLASLFLENFKHVQPVNIILTSNTKQGMEILNLAVCRVKEKNKNIKAVTSYFPFDKPSIMEKAVQEIRPKIMVLIETEIWPGLFFSLKKHGCKILIINGRISLKSLKRYLAWPFLCRILKPDKILTISNNDAKRFARLFGKKIVEIIPNMKFDRILPPDAHNKQYNHLSDFFKPDADFIILGSVRSEEEPQVEKILANLLGKRPDAVIGLFPRHMHRIKHWITHLNGTGIKWILKSEAAGKAPQGSVILWDVFGELSPAYELAKAAFVGGSLMPLGGQNFLEPASCGLVPVIGPYWDNFKWVGNEIFLQGLARRASDWREVADILLKETETTMQRAKMQNSLFRYVKDRQGGTDQACTLVSAMLQEKTDNA